MLGRILCAGLFSAALCLIPQATPAKHVNNSVEAQTPEKVAQTATSKADEELPHTQQPSPQTVKTTEPEKPQAQAKVAVQTVLVTPKDIAKRKAAERGWTGAEWDALVDLWQKESGWNPNAVNKYSGACGIPQALPCSKIPNPQNVESQIDWGLEYISNRYKTPSKALAFWLYEAPKYNGEHWY